MMIFLVLLGFNNPNEQASNKNIEEDYYSITDIDKRIDYALKALENKTLNQEENIQLIQLLEKDYPKIKNQEKLLDLYISVSRTYWKNYQYEQAIENIDLSLDLARKLKNSSKEADALRLLGLVYSEIGDFDKSDKYLFEGLKIYESIDNHKGIIQSLNNIANAFADRKNYEKAKTYYDKSLSIATSIQDSASLAIAYHNLGFLAWENNEFPIAKDYLLKSIKINHDLDNELNAAVSNMALGNVFASENKEEKALQQFEIAEEIFEKHQSKIHLARLNISLSDYYLTKNDFDNSIKFADRAYAIAEELNLETVIIPTAEQLHKIYLAKGDSINANKYGLIYYQLRDQIESNQDLSKVAQLEIIRNIEKKEEQAKIENEKQKLRYFLWFASILFVIIISGLIIYQNIRFKKKEAEMEQQRLTGELETKNKELTLNVMDFMQRKVKSDDLINKLIEIYEATEEETKTKNDILRIIQELKKSNYKNIWKDFEKRFKDVHVSFYNTLIEKYPDLTPNEIRLAAFLRLNLSTKDIAELTGKRVETIEIARSRLRKKLGISNTPTNLVNFLSQIN